jgi:hypothetical protein
MSFAGAPVQQGKPGASQFSFGETVPNTVPSGVAHQGNRRTASSIVWGATEPPPRGRPISDRGKSSLTFGNPEDVTPQPSQPRGHSERITRSNIVLAGPEAISPAMIQQAADYAQVANPRRGQCKSGVTLEMGDAPQQLAHRGARKPGATRPGTTVNLLDGLPDGTDPNRQLNPSPPGQFRDTMGQMKKTPMVPGRESEGVRQEMQWGSHGMVENPQPWGEGGSAGPGHKRRPAPPARLAAEHSAPPWAS